MRYTWYVITAALATGCGGSEAVQPRVVREASRIRTPRFQMEKLEGGNGGGDSRGQSINLWGTVGGFSNSTDGTRRAAIWRQGVFKDLKTLGGPNSNIQWPGLNDLGMAVGISETAEDDSLDETWSCRGFLRNSNAGKVCRGFFWENDRMTALPTFGGTHGFATGINNLGQAVGWAETTVLDPTCNQTPQKLQFRAALWEPKRGRMKQLKPYPGDSTSAATAINDHGVAVGISGRCDQAVGRLSAQHAVVWENGRVRSLPTLAGEGWHTPMALNERGDIVGFGNDAGGTADNLIQTAWIWTRDGGFKRLGGVGDDGTSSATSINWWRQVVGISCNTSCRGFLYDHGTMYDLNDLVDLAEGEVITSASSINDLGWITGRVTTATGTVPFVLRPWR